MRKKPLDMIPFVDIMIAVLFIFATIEEGEKIDVTQLETAKSAKADLEAQLAQANARATALALQRDELQHATELAKEPIRKGVEQRREREVVGALLGEAQVIEVEIEGIPSAEDTVNGCCYRRFAIDAPWKTCGVVPTGAEDRTRWLDDGAGGLLNELNATGATPTMVLVRQEKDAAYNISDKLGESIRTRTPIKKTYAITVDTPVAHCTTGK